MTIFIRDKYNNTVAECDVFTETNPDGTKYVDLSATVGVRAYTNILLCLPAEQIPLFVADMSLFQELRGYFFERFLTNRKNTPELYDEFITELQNIVKEICERHSGVLYMVID